MKKKIKGKRIYLDHAASTPLDPAIKKAMEPYWSGQYGNPGGLHKEGVLARSVVEGARREIACSIAAEANEIIFTSGGTEGNSLAVIGFTQWLEREGRKISDMHFITSAIEHPSVLNIFKELEKRGASSSFIGVSKEGILNLDEFKKALRIETVLVSVMYANNEIGTIQPINEILKILKNHRKKNKSTLPAFHIDASQVPSYLDVNVKKLGIDFMVLDGQKIYGPKGIGVLYMKKSMNILPLFYGGEQERGLRPGTENVPLIVGFKEALIMAVRQRDVESERIKKLRDYFINEVLKQIPNAMLNGHREIRLPNNANFCIPETDNEWITLQLDSYGIAIGTRSACYQSSTKGSHVIKALYKNDYCSGNNYRFTLGRNTTKKDLKYVVDTLVELLKN